VNKFLRTVASSWIFLLTLNHDARKHESKNLHSPFLVWFIPIALWQSCYTNTLVPDLALSVIPSPLSHILRKLIWANLTFRHMSTIRSPLWSLLITSNFLFSTSSLSSTFHLYWTRLCRFAFLTCFGNKSHCPVIIYQQRSQLDYKQVPNRFNQTYIPIVYVLTLHVSGPYWPIIRGVLGCLSMPPFGSCSAVVCPCVRGRWPCRPRTHGETTALHEPNGGIDKEPKTPLMMGQ
jgi:hypothetical protein